MLVIAGPQVDVTEAEVKKIVHYVATGGNLLWLIDQESLHGLQPLAEYLGLVLTPGIAIDPTSSQNGIDPLMKYLASSNAEEIDNKIVDSLRNMLFGPPGAGGLDLASLNIQRGRDHGLADYNATRAALGMPKVTSFSQITSDATRSGAVSAVSTATPEPNDDPTRCTGLVAVASSTSTTSSACANDPDAGAMVLSPNPRRSGRVSRQRPDRPCHG